MRATDAREERASCAEQRTGEATYARGRKCENALELRGRAPAEFPGQAMHGFGGRRIVLVFITTH